MKDREKTKEQLIKELEELWQTNEFLSLLLKSMPVAVYTCEVGGDFGVTYISKNITALTGYKPEDFTSNSEFWFYNVHPDDKEMVNVNLATLLETGHITYEYRWRVADGSYKWFYDISKLMKSPSGETSYILGTWVDITERKKAEEKLQESERKYKSLFEDAGDALFIMDVSEEHGARFLECNDRTLKLFGCTRRDQIIGKTPVDFSPPKQPDGQSSFEKARELASDVIKGHPRCFEWAHYRLNGTPFWVEVTLNRIEFKGEFIMQAVVRDITERKQSEEEIKKSSFYLDSVNDTIIVLNAKREIIKINKEFSKLWGYSQEEVIGKSIFKLFPKEEIPIHQSEMEKGISTKKPRNFETVALTKTGGKVPLSIRGSAIFDKDGKLEGFIGIFRDITERKKAEEELLQYEKELKMKAQEHEESNIALKVLLKQRENDRKELEENILSNIKHLIMPYIEKLKKNKSMSEELTFLNILESNLKEIISPFALKLSANYLGLTPKEIQIADLTKDGKQDKELAEILNISLDTVKFHRKNIRKKLGIYGKRTNLRTYLISIIE